MNFPDASLIINKDGGRAYDEQPALCADESEHVWTQGEGVGGDWDHARKIDREAIVKPSQRVLRRTMVRTEKV
jgi:hypothetical protein